ncbi:unnamed protein product [Alopecurus aequalis]
MAPARFIGPRAAAVAVAIPATSALGKKPRKPRAPKEKPPGMTNKDWIAELTRLKTANIQRRAREAAQRQRQLIAQLAAEDQAAVEEEEGEEEALDEPPTPAASAASPVKRRVGFSPIFAGWNQAVASPSPSPRPSPCPTPAWYVEGDPLGGFNPNLTFPYHPPMLYGASPGYTSSPSHRRAMMAGLQTQDSSFMDEIIVVGSMAAAACPGFLEQGGEFFAQGGGDYGEGGSGGMQDTQDMEADEVDETPVAAPEGGDPAEEGRRPRRPGRPRKEPKAAPTPPVEPRVKWSHREDVLLAEAWKTVSLDPIVGANQVIDNYSKRVKTAYDERRMIDPDFAACVTERGQKTMANHWANIQTACNKWHGIQEEVTNRPKSGANREMELVRMPEAYKNDENMDFKFLHVFVVIEGLRGARSGRRCAVRSARARSTSPTRWLPAVKREEIAKQRWAALMANSQVKIDLLRTGTAAKKRNNDLAFLTGGDPDAMTPEVRAWFMAQCRLILSDISPAPAPTPPDDTSYATPATTCDSPTSSVSPATAPPSTHIDLENAIDLEDAAPVVDLEDAAPAPTPAEASPASA